MEGENTIFHRWEELCARLAVKGDSTSTDVIARLLNKYIGRDQWYHNLRHIKHCLDELDQVGFLLKDPNAVEFALWYHDAIYDSRRTDNEELSARFAAFEAKGLGLNDEFVNEVQALIWATNHVSVYESHDAKFMVDIDLSIFGQSESVFNEYEINIQLEYSHISKEDFRRGRIAVLQKFLDRPNIYSTLHFRNKYEEQARKNLVRSRNLWQRI